MSGIWPSFPMDATSLRARHSKALSTAGVLSSTALLVNSAHLLSGTRSMAPCSKSLLGDAAMHKFGVWAPEVQKMSLKWRDQVLPMNGPNKRGWWTLEVPEAKCGDR